jgi:hypothetical protein
MTTAKIDKYLKDNLTWNSTDLFYAFCEAKGIDDPENDVETDEEYAALENEFCEKITYTFLSRLTEAITQDVNERILYAMD